MEVDFRAFDNATSNIYTINGRIVNVEGDPQSPHSQCCLCPKGAATLQLHYNRNRANRRRIAILLASLIGIAGGVYYFFFHLMSGFRR